MISVDIDLIGIPAFVLDTQAGRGVVRFAGVNRSFVRETGIDAARIVGRTPRECLPADVVDEVEPRYRRCLETGLYEEYDEELSLPGGRRWWRTALSPYVDPASRAVVRIFGVAVEITERKRLEHQLENAAYVDHLTGVANRRRLDLDIDDAMAEAVYTNRPFALIVVDVDAFKSINDRHGHRFGDEILRKVARLLSMAARATGTVARIGGDEFAVKVAAASAAELAETTSALRRFLAGTLSVSGVSVSIGAALWQPGCSFEDVLAEADLDMYREKAVRQIA